MVFIHKFGWDFLFLEKLVGKKTMIIDRWFFGGGSEHILWLGVATTNPTLHGGQTLILNLSHVISFLYHYFITYFRVSD